MATLGEGGNGHLADADTLRRSCNSCSLELLLRDRARCHCPRGFRKFLWLSLVGVEAFAAVRAVPFEVDPARAVTARPLGVLCIWFVARGPPLCGLLAPFPSRSLPRKSLRMGQVHVFWFRVTTWRERQPWQHPSGQGSLPSQPGMALRMSFARCVVAEVTEEPSFAEWIFAIPLAEVGRFFSDALSGARILLTDDALLSCRPARPRVPRRQPAGTVSGRTHRGR